MVDATASPDAIIIQQEQVRSLLRLMRALPERQQDVLMLKFLSGLSNREIAGVLGMREQAVATYLGRGFKQLQKVYRTEETINQGASDEEPYSER